jgi:hypothetical protein
MPSGTKIDLYIKPGWSVRFLNLASGTTYTITEVQQGMEPGYVLKSSNSVETWYVGRDSSGRIPANGYPKTTDFNVPTVTGTVNQTNTDYTVTYTNEYLGVFYVYHSSNNTVERIPMATAGVAYSADHPFDIYAKTAEDTLYGGYYHAYKGSSIEEDGGAELTYTEDLATDEGGTAYSYQYIKGSNRAAWTNANAYTTIGTAMVPVRDKVYFLKEVPTGYLQPYTHYTYYRESKKLSGLLAVLGVDDKNYSDAGFYLITEGKSVEKVVTTLHVKAANSTVTTTLTADSVYKLKGVLAGYLGLTDITSYIGTENLVIRQYWKTIDGIEVLGTTMRELAFGDGTIYGLSKTDKATTPLN